MGKTGNKSDSMKMYSNEKREIILLIEFFAMVKHIVFFTPSFELLNETKKVRNFLNIIFPLALFCFKFV